MIFKKLIWTIKRHPFLYLTRFKLLSKNSNVNEIDDYSYNNVNSKEDIPDYFYEINNHIFIKGKPNTDLELVKALSVWLMKNIKGGPGLSVPSENALKIMLAGDGGVCSDMAQIFNNFCVINDIQVREWGATRAPFNESYGGHSFNEVFSKEINKWVLIDVSYCVMFYYENSIPISVVNLYQLISREKKTRFESFNESVELDVSGVENNYLNSNTIPFLICNYSNKTYDIFLKYSRPYFPVFITHFVLYVLNKSYYYRFPLNDYKKIFS